MLPKELLNSYHEILNGSGSVEMTHYIAELEMYGIKNMVRFIDEVYQNYDYGDIGEIIQGIDMSHYHYLPQLSIGVAISLYSSFENCLNSVCLEYEGTLETKITLDDMKGSAVFRSVRYLQKVIGMDLTGSLWEEIQAWNVFRNCLVHNGTVIRNQSDKKKVESIGLEVDEKNGDCITFSVDDLERMATTFHEFIKLIISQWREMHGTSK
ncbi:hypothetical protein OS242_10485 [Tumebacillus sp. DT12]|uniref:MAE-28990/MAE-18760-like HEPN domain-containing protein n=1 Tax=Tumebacillus lacus TaxID=2995335 RepID=A0ABT3X0G6_9BACL|nr:hypothetical protein [Tumebacillus lacus]MCX7570390.1 hypothetical protein [Tumebacillus lacus]